MPRPTSGKTGAYIQSAGNSFGSTGAQVSAAEGIDKLTFLVPKTGLYRVSGAIVTTTVSGGAAAGSVRVTHNNGSAIAAAAIVPGAGVTPTAHDATAAPGAANSWISREQLIYAVAGTNIVLDVAVSATATLWRYSLVLQVEAV